MSLALQFPSSIPVVRAGAWCRITLLAAAAVVAVAPAHATLLPGTAPLKTLFVGFDGGVDRAMTDILGTDTRFDRAGSTAISSYGSNPSLTNLQLAGYDSVLVWGNYSPSAEFGNQLADYADGGGRVVMATFLGYYASYGTDLGRINSHGYNPFVQGTTDAYQSVSMGVHDAAAPIFAGVQSVNSNYYNGDWLAVDADATLLGSWSNGRPMVGVNAAGNVLNVTMFPNVATYSHGSGDYAQLFRNALAYEGGTANSLAAQVPEPSSMLLVALSVVALVATTRRRRPTVTLLRD